MSPRSSLPSRDDVERGRVRDLVPGHRWKARVVVFQWNDRLWVLKDLASMTAFARVIFGRPGLRREARIYRRLGGLHGVPESLGLIDRNGLILEYVEAPALSRRTIPDPPGPFLDELERTLHALHERRIVHLDLRQKRNVLVRPDGRPIVIDFESAQYCGRGPFGRLLMRVGRWIDWTALVKYRHRYADHTLDDEGHETWRRYERWRRFWVFTPHKARQPKRLKGEPSDLAADPPAFPRRERDRPDCRGTPSDGSAGGDAPVGHSESERPTRG